MRHSRRRHPRRLLPSCPHHPPTRRIHETEEKYYADGEDAFAMRKTFQAAVDKAAADKAAAEKEKQQQGTPDKDKAAAGWKGGKRR